MPSITVVLPVFNRASVIPRAVGSVLVQTFADFELIVVDDGSRDGTAAFLAGLSDHRVRVVTIGENRGACAARNRGIAEARGEILCFLDSDDFYLPGKLACVASMFEARPELDLLVDSFVCHKGDGPDRRVKPKLNPPGLDGPGFRSALFERRIFKATSAISVRRRALLEVGFFDEYLRRRQDMDLVLRLSRKHVCTTTDLVLWEKYESRDAISRDHGLFLQASIDICERHPEYLTRHPACLYRDLRSHFAWLARHRKWRNLLVDARRYARYVPFEHSLVRLMFDGRVSGVAQDDSIQRTRKDSGSPSNRADNS
ncbi:MAG: glycosyltransferase [Myxococcota bacterium]